MSYTFDDFYSRQDHVLFVCSLFSSLSPQAVPVPSASEDDDADFEKPTHEMEEVKPFAKAELEQSQIHGAELHKGLYFCAT
jgi:hypothetical protein